MSTVQVGGQVQEWAYFLSDWYVWLGFIDNESTSPSYLCGGLLHRYMVCQAGGMAWRVLQSLPCYAGSGVEGSVQWRYCPVYYQPLASTHSDTITRQYHLTPLELSSGKLLIGTNKAWFPIWNNTVRTSNQAMTGLEIKIKSILNWQFQFNLTVAVLMTT